MLMSVGVTVEDAVSLMDGDAAVNVAVGKSSEIVGGMGVTIAFLTIMKVLGGH